MRYTTGKQVRDLMVLSMGATVMLLVCTGCTLLDRFQDATTEDCVAAFERSLSVLSKEQEDDALVREVALLAVNWVADKAGTRERLVRQCRAKATRHDAKCVLNASSSAELNQCEFFRTWD